MISTLQDIKLPKILWLWIPLIGIIAKIKTEFYMSHQDVAWLVGENGAYEILQAIILVVALLTAVYTLIKMDKSNKWLMAWVALSAVCCLYVAGEEISWGQHILKWNTPDYWNTLNDQGETNFHNTTSWLDQKPRLLLSIGVYVGGIIIPLLLMYRQSILNKFNLMRFSSIFPTKDFILVGALCLVIKIFDKLADVMDFQLFARNAESEEMYLFYFVLLYVILMKKRLVDQG